MIKTKKRCPTRGMPTLLHCKKNMLQCALQLEQVRKQLLEAKSDNEKLQHKNEEAVKRQDYVTAAALQKQIDHLSIPSDASSAATNRSHANCAGRANMSKSEASQSVLGNEQTGEEQQRVPLCDMLVGKTPKGMRLLDIVSEAGRPLRVLASRLNRPRGEESASKKLVEVTAIVVIGDEDTGDEIEVMIKKPVAALKSIVE